MSEREVFMEAFRKARMEGLLDVKFFVQNGDSLSKEEFFAAANRIDATAQTDEGTKVWRNDLGQSRASFLT